MNVINSRVDDKYELMRLAKAAGLVGVECVTFHDGPDQWERIVHVSSETIIDVWGNPRFEESDVVDFSKLLV